MFLLLEIFYLPWLSGNVLSAKLNDNKIIRDRMSLEGKSEPNV